MSPQGIDGRSLRISGWLCGAWLLAATACEPGTAPTPDHFRFRPPDGTRFVQKLVVTRQQEFTGGPKQSNVSASRTEFIFERTQDGYRVRAESRGSEFFRNGESIEDPVTDLLRRIPGEFDLDPNGRLRAIHGFENVADRIVLELPPELATALEPVPLAVLAYGKGAAQESPTAPKPERVPAHTATGPEGSVVIPAPLQGTVVTVDVAEGDTVLEGQQVAIMEAMKMEHEIRATASGIVREVAVAPGDTLYEGHALLFIELTQVDSEHTVADRQVDLDHIRPDLREIVDRHDLTLDAARRGSAGEVPVY